MTLAPKRRWSYSLRTLFAVVTVLGVALGWGAYSLNWIEQRHSLCGQAAYMLGGSDDGTAPGLLWLFGEQGFARMRIKFEGDPKEAELNERQREILKRLRQAYSEAEIEVVPPYAGKPI
jgi:hypothetical protein